MTAAPAGQKKAAAENPPVTDETPELNAQGEPITLTASGSPEEGAALPTPRGPLDPIPEGEVQVTRKAKDNEPSDPGGNSVEVKTASKRSTKKDPLTDIDLEKLPVAVSVGQFQLAIEVIAGNPVLKISLVDWVGEAPIQVRANEVGELEAALAELRKVV